MCRIPPAAEPLLREFSGAFTRPTDRRFVVLLRAAIRTPGRRTVTNLLRTVQTLATGHPSSDPRVFSRRRWSSWRRARALAEFIRRRWVPEGPVRLAGDDTVDEHRGKKAYGKACHRHAVRSTHSFTAYRWGHKGVVLAVLVKFPFAQRLWALPVLVALYRSKEWNRKHGRRHKTPSELLRELLVVLIPLVSPAEIRLCRRRRVWNARLGGFRPSASRPSDPGQPLLSRRELVRPAAAGAGQEEWTPAPEGPQAALARGGCEEGSSIPPDRGLVRGRYAPHRSRFGHGSWVPERRGPGSHSLGLCPRPHRHAPRRIFLHHRSNHDPANDRRDLQRSLVHRDHVPGDARLPGSGEHAGSNREDRAPPPPPASSACSRWWRCGTRNFPRAAPRRRGSSGPEKPNGRSPTPSPRCGAGSGPTGLLQPLEIAVGLQNYPGFSGTYYSTPWLPPHSLGKTAKVELRIDARTSYNVV